MDLEGKHVVITGGSSGMGLATAAGAAAAGAKVTIASSDQSRLDAALAALPGGCNGVVVDARSEASVAEVLAQIGEAGSPGYTAGDSVALLPRTRCRWTRPAGCSTSASGGRSPRSGTPPPGSGRAARSCDVRDGRGPPSARAALDGRCRAVQRSRD